MLRFPRDTFRLTKPQRSPVQPLPNEVLTAALKTPSSFRREQLKRLARAGCKNYEQANGR